MENKIVVAYLIYLPTVLILTLYVARTLFKNGRIFMMDIFNGREEIALSTNKLFEVGFYLINVGYALLVLQINEYANYQLDTYQELVEALAAKVGGFAIYLGVMLFLNMFLFFRGKKMASQNRANQALREKIGATPAV